MLNKYSFQLQKDTSLHYLIGLFCLFVYAGALFFPLFDKDAAHHANMALYMYEHNDPVSLIDRGKDYLDKPHFLFWTSLLSFKIFGVNEFAHRLPHILFALISILSVYKLTVYLSDKTTAKMAALMLATAQGFVLSINDARMETPLTASIIFAIWQLILYTEKRKLLYLFLGALGAAIAFSTKGWLGPVIIFVSLFFYIALNRKWDVFISARTWLIIPFFLTLIAPVLYAYYLQFDLHPEKIIRDKSGRSGVRFILWDQLFERASGFDVKKRHGNYFFLYHTFLWSFFPWSLFAYVAVVFWIKRMFYKKKWKHPFHFAALAFAFILFAISFSRFKMPHYTVMLLPLAALFTAPWLRFILSTVKGVRCFYPLQLFFAILLTAVCIVLNYYFFPPHNLFVWLAGTPLLLLMIWLLLKRFRNKALKVFVISFSMSLLTNFFLNYNIFPILTTYQAGKDLAEWTRTSDLNITDDNIVVLDHHSHSYDFYLKKNHRIVEGVDFAKAYPEIRNSYFLLTPRQGRDIAKEGFVIEPVAVRPDYNIATIKFNFLLPKTRYKVLDTLMVARIHQR